MTAEEPADKRIKGWPYVETSAVGEKHRTLYITRCSAVHLRVLERKRPKDVMGETGVRPSELAKLIEKAESQADDGQPLGYRALVPYWGRTYRRKKGLNPEALNGEGQAGLFQKLLEDHPENIADWLEVILLKGELLPNGKYRRVAKREIPELFITRCRDIGIQPNQYPFTSDTKGERSLYRHLKKIEEENQEAVLRARSGGSVEVSFRSDSTGASIWKPTRLFERLQIDGHRVDALAVVEVPSPTGMPTLVPLFDVWILTLVSRDPDILFGHVLCLTGNYNRYDVMRCLASAMGFRLPHDGQQDFLPVHFLPDLAWISMDELELDRALAHRAFEVNEIIHETFNARARFGTAHTPKKRPQVEAVYAELESRAITRVPSALKPGGSMSDRKKAVAMAMKHKITASDLEEIVRRAHYAHLTRPQLKHSGRSRLDYLKWYLADQDEGLRKVPSALQTRSSVMRLMATATVVGDPKSGKRPHLNWMYGEYHGPRISASAEFLGKEVTLIGDPDDVRVMKVYLENEEIDTVTVGAPWAARPHSVETRRRAGKEFRKRKMSLSTLHDGISAYEGLMIDKNSEEGASRKDAKELSRLQREAGGTLDHPAVPRDEDVHEPETKVVRIRPGRKAIHF